MESELLATPTGISARIVADPASSDHDRRHRLARELISSLLNVGDRGIRFEREAPAQFGFHTHLIAHVAGSPVPLQITTASVGALTVVGIAEPRVSFGFDIRVLEEPGDDELRWMRRQAHLYVDADVPTLVRHWSWIRAIGAADGRQLRAQPLVQLDVPRGRGWVRDRHITYDVIELPVREGTVTLAHHTIP